MRGPLASQEPGPVLLGLVPLVSQEQEPGLARASQQPVLAPLVSQELGLALARVSQQPVPLELRASRQLSPVLVPLVSQVLGLALLEPVPLELQASRQLSLVLVPLVSQEPEPVQRIASEMWGNQGPLPHLARRSPPSVASHESPHLT